MKLLRARSSWTSTAPGGVALSGPVEDLFIHHTAGALPKDGVNATMQAEAALIRATREFHINDRGMSDIAYSYGFMPSGRAYILRGHRTGGHTFCCNSTSIAFLFFGTSDAVPREALDNALTTMRAERAHQVEIGNLTRGHRIRGHREVGGQFGPTACPGNRLFDRLAEIEEEGDMGFAEFSEAYAERWNQLVAGEAQPKVQKIPTGNDARRDAALGQRQADADFASLKGHKTQSP
jgi:hypothetical protein